MPLPLKKNWSSKQFAENDIPTQFRGSAVSTAGLMKPPQRLRPSFWSAQGRHFNERYLAEIGVHAAKNPTLVDTRWIDKFVFLSSEPLEKISTEWIDHYWQGKVFTWEGEETIAKQPQLECLIDGTALIWGTKLRIEAFGIIERLAPDAIGVLEKGRFGVDLCTRFDGKEEWRLRQITPMIFTDPDRTTMWIRYPILLDESLAASVNAKVVKAGIKAEEINSRALQVFQKGSFTMPDLRPLEVSLAWMKDHPLLQLKLNQTLTAFFFEHGGDIDAARKLQDGKRRVG